MDCGLTCHYMIGRYYGRIFSLEKLRELVEIDKEGVNLLSISGPSKKMEAVTKELAELRIYSMWMRNGLWII